MRIVGIVEGQATGLAQIVVKFALGLLHPFEGAEAQNVRLAHVGDQAAGGLGDLHQRGDLARGGRAQLDHGRARPGVDAEEGERHADMVVQVAVGINGFVLAGHHGAHQFLRGGLAVGAGDADHGDIELAAVVGGQILQRFQHVFNQIAFALAGLDALQRGAVHHRDAGALFEGLHGEVVAVKGLAFEGEEHRTFRDGAAVGGDAAALLEEFV